MHFTHYQKKIYNNSPLQGKKGGKHTHTHSLSRKPLKSGGSASCGVRRTHAHAQRRRWRREAREEECWNREWGSTGEKIWQLLHRWKQIATWLPNNMKSISNANCQMVYQAAAKRTNIRTYTFFFPSFPVHSIPLLLARPTFGQAVTRPFFSFPPPLFYLSL